MVKYIVTAIVNHRRINLSKSLEYREARMFIKSFRKDMRIAISKYRFASKIKLEKVQ